MNYEKMNFDELRKECVRRGFLDENNNHIRKESLDDSGRRQRTDEFMKQNNITQDEFMALLDLAMEDKKFKHYLLEQTGWNE